MYDKYPDREVLRSPFEGPGETDIELEYVPALSCSACGHVWNPQVDRPKYCPKCHAAISWEESDIDSPMSELYHKSLSDEDGNMGELTRFQEEPEVSRTGDATGDATPSGNEADKEETDEETSWRKQ